jgi:hypothetical protein
MAQINTGVVDSNELSHHEDDPGAYPFPCGEFAGKRLDTVSSNRRQWAAHADRARHSWYPAYIKANQRYEELLLQTPEAYPFPFGKHEDKRLDEVPEDLIWWSVDPLRSDMVWHRNLAEANRLYLDKVYDQKSPGSVTMWFGGKKGQRLDDVYKCSGYIEWCLRPEQNKYAWYYRFEDLVQRYKNYLQTHSQPYQPRAPAHVENPTGQLLGRGDDSRGSVEPDNDYERDGSVVNDDEEIHQGNGGDSKPANNTNDRAVADDSGAHDEKEHAYSESAENSCADRSVAQAEGLSPTHTIMIRLFEGRKTRVTSSDNRQRICHPNSDEETDTADQLPLKRLRRRSEHKVQGSAQTDSHSDAQSAAQDEAETPDLHQLSQSFSTLSLSQESAGSLNNDDELPRTPRRSARLQAKSARCESGNDGSGIPKYDTHTNTPSRLGRSYRVLVQLDVEE